MTAIVIITITLIVLFIFVCGYILGKLKAHSIYENEIIWLENQSSKILKAKEEVEKNFKILEQSYENVRDENEWLVMLIEKYQDRFWPYKLTIAEMYKDTIIELFKEWKSNYQIAQEIGCSRSTILRAVNKRWLKR